MVTMFELNNTFKALLREAHFTREVLGAGATQIRTANYATHGIYFQAFTSLSTGLERIGKLCLMLDHYIENNGSFPDFSYMKNEIGHNLALLYEKSQVVSKKRAISFRYTADLSDPIHQAIVRILSEFAVGDRYSNINLLVGSRRQGNPIAAWYEQVDRPLYENHVPLKKKERIGKNAEVVAVMMEAHSSVLHFSENGDQIVNLREVSFMTGVQESVAPYRQLYVLQIIRYWVKLLSSLQQLAMGLGRNEIPFFGEVLGLFYNSDAYFRTRRTWNFLD